jgi:hypothetical protein
MHVIVQPLKSMRVVRTLLRTIAGMRMLMAANTFNPVVIDGHEQGSPCHPNRDRGLDNEARQQGTFSASKACSESQPHAAASIAQAKCCFELCASAAERRKGRILAWILPETSGARTLAAS